MSGRVLAGHAVNPPTEIPTLSRVSRLTQYARSPAAAISLIDLTSTPGIDPDILDTIVERAAILEHDAGLPRSEAERKAITEHMSSL